MKLNHLKSRGRKAFTMAELMVAMAMMSMLGVAVYGLSRTGAILAAKSSNLNQSHGDLRGAFDRVADHLLAANNVPTLIGTDGLTASGPAAGFKFDRVVGDPYVLDPALTAGSLSSSATSLSVWRSTLADTGAPVPIKGDILVIPTPTGNIRAIIKTVSTAAPASNRQKVTVTLNSAVGKSLTWAANQPQTAKLLRPEAFLVMPVNGRNQLRFYPNFEPMPNLNDTANYQVLTDQVGTATGESTPFSILDINGPNGDRMLQSTLRVRETNFSKSLAQEEANSYSGYFQLLVKLPSRLRPKTTN